MASSTHAPKSIRDRAVKLLTSFFEQDDERSRRAILNEAFDGCHPNPARTVNPAGSLELFAAETVDKLLSFGCAGRGKHALALLIETMASARGWQSHPDYADLPANLNCECALPTRAEQRAYLTRLIQQMEEKARFYSPLAGLAAQHSHTDHSAYASLLPEAHQQILLRYQPLRADRHVRDYEDILTAFDQIKQAVLLGGPGSGKSTTLRRLALNLAERALADGDAPLPMFATLGDWRGDELLSQFLADQCSEIGWGIDALAEKGKVILLLDGLNEMPTDKRGGKARDIKTFCETFKKCHAGNAIFTSCRREDYVGDLDLGLETLTLEPLSSQRIYGALRSWIALGTEPPETADRIFWQLAGDERLQEAHRSWLDAGLSEETFWSGTPLKDHDFQLAGKIGWGNYGLWRWHISNPRSLLRLASNPYMLAMLFRVWIHQRQLPQNRGGLFRRFVDTLLQREHLLDTEDGGGLLKGLAELAWRMQRERVEEGKEESSQDFAVLTVVSPQVALDCFKSERLLGKAQDATLLEQTDQVRFRHQLLQEYFTASALLEKRSSMSAEELWPPDRWWERSGWEETVVLLAGFFEEDCAEIIRWVAEAQPEVAAQCIEQSGAEIANKDALLGEFQAHWLPLLTDVQNEPRPEARAAMGRALGRLNLDHRPGVGLRPDGLPDIDWVKIEGGEFIYQQAERRTVRTFWIGRYPVTNAQWQAFVKSHDGYGNDDWWAGLTNPTRQPDTPSWTEANHPVTDVSWFEAVAFSRWLGSKLGKEVRVPTEWEWERAARGPEGREYPWEGGYLSGYANIHEQSSSVGPHYLRRTSPVGMYPQGATEEGVHDLAGNVWEWCMNEFHNPRRVQFGGTDARVVRGGSWDYDLDFARAQYRFYYYQPVNRYSRLGFRVVVSSPIGKR